MKTLAVYSMKGGVGKSAAAVNLAFAAAREGLSTLVCDLDPQAASGYYLRVKPKGVSARKLVRGKKSAAASIKATDYANLDVLPASVSFRHLAVALADAGKRRTRLGKVLRNLGAGYDLLVLDVHSGLDLEAENVLGVADLVLMPVIPTTLSVNSFVAVRDFMRRRGLDASRLCIFFSMVDRRRRLHRQVMEELAGEPAALSVAVPYSSQVEQMGVYREPLLARHPASRAAEAYTALWVQVRRLLGFPNVTARRDDGPGD